VTQLSYEVVVRMLRTAGCVFAEDEAALLLESARSSDELAAMVERRVAGEPLEVVVGWASFCGLQIEIDAGVFVPRLRTEFLVDEAARLVELVRLVLPSGEPVVVVDLCCGSGALGVALAESLHAPVELYATDIDPRAVECARRNADVVGGQVFEGDLDEPLPDHLRGHVEVLLANVPYVPSDAIARMPAEARLHEPRATLDGGADGLDVLRRVAALAPQWLAPGGHLLVETSEAQAAEACAAFEAAGLAARVAVDPDREATAIVGTLLRG
jgi:release factor glutamine methyltransferase